MSTKYERFDRWRFNIAAAAAFAAEHKGIVAALDRLRAAAEAENKPQGAQFARNLAAHDQNEEQITYPAAILVGEYLKLKPER